MTNKIMTERVQVVLSSDELSKLEALAVANSGGNKSLMMRKLINLAYEQPELLSLHPVVEH